MEDEREDPGGKRGVFCTGFFLGFEGEVEAWRRGVALKDGESCDRVLLFFSCLFWCCNGGERDLAKEKGEARWEAENKKARTFRKEVDRWSFRKDREIWS